MFVRTALAGAMLCGSVNAHAAALTWTMSNIIFDQSGFQSRNIDGTFDYDAATNIFSNINLTFKRSQQCCWGAGVETSTSTASALDFYAVGQGPLTFHIDLASPMTNAGGTIALTSGFSMGSHTLRAGQFISAPVAAAVPEPASWALMIGGFALAGAAMRHRRRAISATFA